MKNETITITKTITEELDPCKAPEGCPELEPWMAYVGLLSDQPRQPPLLTMFFANEPLSDDWMTKGRGGCGSEWPCCIDVRTEWAQEHFPEHCRIRNYQEPDAFERLCDGWALDKLQYAGPTYLKAIVKQAYELGQQNPTTK